MRPRVRNFSQKLERDANAGVRGGGTVLFLSVLLAEGWEGMEDDDEPSIFKLDDVLGPNRTRRVNLWCIKPNNKVILAVNEVHCHPFCLARFQQPHGVVETNLSAYNRLDLRLVELRSWCCH
jgi:hypothetical protein